MKLLISSVETVVSLFPAISGNKPDFPLNRDSIIFKELLFE